MRNLRTLALFTSLLALTACGGGELTVDEMELEESFEVDESALSTGRFEVFAGEDGKHYFQLLAGNGQKVLTSEGYSTASGAKNGVETVRRNGVVSSRYLLRQADDGSAYVVLTGGNGAIIGVSDMYATEANANRGAEMLVRVMQNAPSTPWSAEAGARFTLFKGLDSKHYFNVRARNGEIILQSQGYTTATSAKNGIASVKANGASAARYEIRAARDGKYYFVLKASNGRIIGRGETYASKYNAERGVQTTVRTLTVDAR